MGIKKEKVKIFVNDDYHNLSGDDVCFKQDADFIKYRQKWEEWPSKCHVGKFPLFIDIEVTNVCNLKCPFCATTISGDKYKKGFIEVNDVKKIIDEGKDNGLYGVKFNIRGEPLLHPKIDYFVEYAKKSGLIDVYFNTNAMMLSDEMIRKMIDARLDRISISCEGYNKYQYEKNRVGASFDILLKNIINLQNIKEQKNVAYPKVRIQSIINPKIKFDKEQYINFWASMVNEVGFLDYKDMGSKKRGIEHSWICPQIWQRMGVLWNGDIFPCNHDDEHLLKLGNIKNNTLKECWESTMSDFIRDNHRNGEGYKIKACDGCYLRNSEIFKLG